MLVIHRWVIDGGGMGAPGHADNASYRRDTENQDGAGKASITLMTHAATVFSQGGMG